MYHDDRKFDFHPLGRKIKRRRQEKGWTQEQLGQIVDRTDRAIMYIENRGTHPSFNVFYKIVTLLDISVDQFFYPEKADKTSDSRKRIDILLNSLDEKELKIVEATIQAMKDAKEAEDV